MTRKSVLPKWLRQAMGARVIVRWEAHAIYKLIAGVPRGQVVEMPESLWPAAKRLHLWQRPSPSQRLH